MNVGEVFDQGEQILTIEQRLEKLEQMLPSLLSKISMCNKLNEALEEHKKATTQIAQDVQSIQDWIKDATERSDKIELLIRAVEKNVEAVKDNVQECFESGKKITQASIQDVYKAIKAVQDDCNRGQAQVRMIASEKLQQSDLQPFLSEIITAKSQVRENHAECKAELKALTSHCEALFSQASGLAVGRVEMQQAINAKADEVSASIGKAIADLHAPVKEIKCATVELRDKVHAIESRPDNDYSGVIKQQQALHEKMNLTSLDSTNAVLRTDHMDKRLLLLERKLENVDLRLKNQEH